MANTMIKELETMVSKLHAERQSHLDSIAEIDKAFGELGISPGAAPGRRGHAPKGATRKYVMKSKVRAKGPTGNRYPVSGTNSILNFVAKAGAKGVSGGEIDKHWKAEGRAGSAYNIMSQLIKTRKLKKQKAKNQRGSIYTTGSAAT